MYKIFTHDLRSPLQTERPVWDGSLPYELPSVNLDTSDVECAAGWNFCEDLPTAFKIAGLWRHGRPARAFRIEPGEDVIKRGNKHRS